MEQLLLFYRYMLPYFTAEVYSWADPAEAVFGFKTGVENGLFRFPAFRILMDF